MSGSGCQTRNFAILPMKVVYRNVWKRSGRDWYWKPKSDQIRKRRFISVMNLPADTLQLSQEEQGRLLARVYAFILSDQFTGIPHECPRTQCRGRETGKTVDVRSTKKRKIQFKETTHVLDAQTIQVQEPTTP